MTAVDLDAIEAEMEAHQEANRDRGCWVCKLIRAHPMAAAVIERGKARGFSNAVISQALNKNFGARLNLSGAQVFNHIQQNHHVS